VNRSQLLTRLGTAWLEFTASYAGLSDSELLEPGVSGSWSIRDLIAHVTTWEDETLTLLPAIMQGRRLPRYSTTYGSIEKTSSPRTRVSVAACALIRTAITPSTPRRSAPGAASASD
jgi:hypothetical protein